MDDCRPEQDTESSPRLRVLHRRIWPSCPIGCDVARQHASSLLLVAAARSASKQASVAEGDFWLMDGPYWRHHRGCLTFAAVQDDDSDSALLWPVALCVDFAPILLALVPSSRVEPGVEPTVKVSGGSGTLVAVSASMLTNRVEWKACGAGFGNPPQIQEQ